MYILISVKFVGEKKKNNLKVKRSESFFLLDFDKIIELILKVLK